MLVMFCCRSEKSATTLRLNWSCPSAAEVRAVAPETGIEMDWPARSIVVFAPGRADDASKPGVHVQDIGLDPSAPIRKYEPGHPDADAKGFVSYPNIDPTTEYINAMDASRAYEANVTMMDDTKAMINASLRIIA